jgi:hypothetical protein
MSCTIIVTNNIYKLADIYQIVRVHLDFIFINLFKYYKKFSSIIMSNYYKNLNNNKSIFNLF